MIKGNLGNRKILAIIPARGGSKGLPGKNIKIFNGKPLIAWTIEAALKSKYINRVIVSTEDPKIKKISRDYKTEIVERPNHLAEDASKVYDVIEHALNFLSEKEKYYPDVIVLLQPTSPLRNTKDIDGALDIFLKNECDSVVSVYESTPPIYWAMEANEKYLKPVFDKKYFSKRRQDLAITYNPNGAAYVSNVDNFNRYKGFYSENILPFVMPIERSIDIDSEIDFILAETLMKKSDGKN